MHMIEGVAAVLFRRDSSSVLDGLTANRDTAKSKHFVSMPGDIDELARFPKRHRYARSWRNPRAKAERNVRNPYFDGKYALPTNVCNRIDKLAVCGA